MYVCLFIGMYIWDNYIKYFQGFYKYQLIKKNFFCVIRVIFFILLEGKMRQREVR